MLRKIIADRKIEYSSYTSGLCDCSTSDGRGNVFVYMEF